MPQDQDTLKATLDMTRAVAKAADIKIHRGFTDFLADRIVQATTQPTLLAMMERLAALLNTQMEYVGAAKVAAFMRNVNAFDAPAVLDWLRDYPRVVAMIVMQRSDESYQECIQDLTIEVSARDKGVALPTRRPAIPITVTCLSPLAHGADTKAGNATIFRRMQVLSDTGQVLALPFYAGNALRGQLRDLLADHFLAALGLTPRKDDPPCNLWFFHALYAGGALEENSAQAKALSKRLGANGAVRADGVHELRNMLPPLSLLGTALGNRVLSGRVNVCDLRPRCQEWGNGAIPVGNLFEWTYLTRREDHENHAEGDHSGMIANTECLKAGTILEGGIDLSDHATIVEQSCLAKGLMLLQSHGYLGAENRRGLGLVEIELKNIANPIDYEAYLESHKAEILTYLTAIGAINAPGQTDSE
jgi:hypothetical protein